jgi:flagellar basal body-associated protein FliL
MYDNYPTTNQSSKKYIIFIAIAAVILIATIISLIILFSGNNSKTLVCEQTIGEGDNTQTTKLTFKYDSNGLKSGQMHAIYKIEDEFTEDYIDSIKANIEEEQFVHVSTNKVSDHELTIDADIKPERTPDNAGGNYDKTKSYLTSTGMTCR